jgi:hypothetical protein
LSPEIRIVADAVAVHAAIANIVAVAKPRRDKKAELLHKMKRHHLSRPGINDTFSPQI